MKRRFTNLFSVLLISCLLSGVNISQINILKNTSPYFENENNQTNIYFTQQYSNGESLVIIVENTLWSSSSIKTAINQYRLDLNNTGYQTFLYTNIISNVTYLRQLLQLYWTIYQISGAILIGDLPFAKFYHTGSTNFAAETFICDLFLMDLDGTWIDGPTPDGILDSHFGAPGDIYPEIYVGRIDASNRTLGGLTNEQNILNVLNRIHNYRTGGVSRTHQALTYIDDDWQAWANGTYDTWPSWLQNPYPVKTDIHTPATYTNSTDWLNRITQDYEWAHLCVHSNSTKHFFGPGGSGEGGVNSNAIHTTRPTFNFYNLFCCKGADWLQTDCLATTYLYSSDYSLSVIGTSKSGGMLGGPVGVNSFYNYLAQNESIGKSFYNWFQGITSYSSAEYIGWFYGMTIIGDPTLTIHYDCTVFEPIISSSTHPNQYQWYTDDLPQLNWSVPIDVNGITGYYYILDQNPLTIPTKSTGIFTTINGTKITTALADGTWYLHVVAKDGAGNIGTTASHYTLLIDNTPPSITITSPVDGAEFEPGEIVIQWSVTETGSGYQYAAIRVNGTVENSVYLSNTYNLTLEEENNYVINITAFDYFGLSSSDDILIIIKKATSTTTNTLFGIPIKYIIIGGSVLGGIIIITVAIVIVVKVRKRKVRIKN